VKFKNKSRLQRDSNLNPWGLRLRNTSAIGYPKKTAEHVFKRSDSTYIGDLHFFYIINTINGKHTLVDEGIESWVWLNQAHLYNKIEKQLVVYTGIHLFVRY